ncbi:MAG: FliA/WhiG family RNA polymerase sigma factor [Myxococcales bacterium]|nr:FliA/WhiG family RNA polymerase sigma factor [Myxococcales bacterium]
MKAQIRKKSSRRPTPAAAKSFAKRAVAAAVVAESTATGEELKGTRDEILIEFAPVVKQIASRMALRLPPNVEVDDLVSAGTLGLIDALDKFDAKRGISFRAYSEFRIRGSMLDELRSQDWISRSLRKKYKRYESTMARLEQQFGRHPTDEEMCEALGTTLEEYRSFMARMGSFSFISVDELAETAPNQSTKLVSTLGNSGDGCDPFEAALHSRTSEILGEAIDQLPDSERLVVHMYYYEDLNMKEIGEVMGISESRISQIHSKAMLRMKTKVRRYREAVAG